MFIRFGGDLLSRGLSPSTIGAEALNFRVREGTGCIALAMTTKPNKHSLSALGRLRVAGLSGGKRVATRFVRAEGYQSVSILFWIAGALSKSCYGAFGS